MSNWDKFYLEMSRLMSTRSKDPSTQTGAVIVDAGRHVVSAGYNGFPKDMRDDPKLYANREEKYSRIIHCEMNALLHAKLPLPEGCTLYTWPFASCDRCVVHMLQAGIKRYVAPVCPDDKRDRWEAILFKTYDYVRECGGQMLLY